MSLQSTCQTNLHKLRRRQGRGGPVCATKLDMALQHAGVSNVGESHVNTGVLGLDLLIASAGRTQTLEFLRTCQHIEFAQGDEIRTAR